MAKTKKFNFRITQKETEWITEITRRVSSRKTIVSKSQGGFSSELEASNWGMKELTSFLENLNERNKRDSEENNKAKPSQNAEVSS